MDDQNVAVATNCKRKASEIHMMIMILIKMTDHDHSCDCGHDFNDNSRDSDCHDYDDQDVAVATNCKRKASRKLDSNYMIIIKDHYHGCDCGHDINDGIMPVTGRHNLQGFLAT